MVRCYFFFFTFLLLTSLRAQTEDVNNLIEFNSDLERSFFQDLYNGDTNGVALLIVAGGIHDSTQLSAYSARLEEVFGKLDSAKLVRKKPKKIISTVFETVHDELLRKYEFNNQFCEVFQTGNYNCVSATALYSYMLGRLGVAHVIVQTPDHVYAIAGIEDESWVLESTDPQQGYYELTEKDRQKSLDMLVDQKIITPEQRRSPKLDSIINALFPEEAISASKLVSIQYSNQAYYELDKDNSYKAFQNAARAFVISPDTATSALLLVSAGLWLDENDFENEHFFPALTFVISKYNSNKEDQGAAFDAFLYYGASYLEGSISDSVFNTIAEAYIEGTVADTLFQNKIISYYNDYIAQKMLTSRRALQAFPYAKSAVKHYCDKESQRIMVGTVSMIVLYGQSKMAHILDSIRTIDNQYPQMRENEIWVPLYLEILAHETFSRILKNDFTTARELFVEFEANANSDYVAVMDKRDLEKVYGRILTNYHKTDKQRARQILHDGLSYMPDSEILLYYKRKLDF